MTRLSIVIPAASDQQKLEDTLVSVLSNRPHDCEVLVVFPGPYEDPYDLREEVRFVELSGAPNRVESLNAGIASSRGEIVHLLEPGIEVQEGWTDFPLQWFARDSAIGTVCPLVVCSSNPTCIFSAGVKYGRGGIRKVEGAGQLAPRRMRTSCAVDGPTLSAGFYRRSAVAAVRGFDVDIGDELADIDMAISLHALGFRCVFEPGHPLTTRLDLQSNPRRGLQHGRFVERLFWKHASKFGWTRSMLLHAAAITIDILSAVRRPTAVTRLVGRAVSMGEFLLGTQRRRTADKRRQSPDWPNVPGQRWPSTEYLRKAG